MIDAALISDGGQLSVMRPLAAYAFGAWTVTWPDDFDAPTLDDERRLGFVADLPERRKPGRLARRFTRVDAEINAVDGGSNVEEILDEAARRTAGREFFEREIGPAGFGRLVPGVDVRVNDRKPVLLWRRILPDQLVTELRFNADGTASAQVGGQPVSDDLRRIATNRENDLKIMAERRENDELVRAVNRSTKAAVSEAKKVAGEALEAVNDAEGQIQGYLRAAAEANEEGRGYAAEALAAREKAAESYESAMGALEEVERLVAEGESVLAENKELADQVRRLHSQLDTLKASITNANRQMGALVGSASASAVLSLQYTESAKAAVDEARLIRSDVSALLDEAAEAIEEGSRHVSKALEYSESARGAVTEAKQFAENAAALADKAEETLDGIRRVKEEADSAVDAAGAHLEDLKRESEAVAETLSEIDRLQSEVLIAHDDILAKHRAVLNAHDTAIRAVSEGVRAAGASAASASMGAMWAQLTADEAARAAASALDAGKKNAEAIRLLDEAMDLHEQAIDDLAAAQELHTKAIKDLTAAGELQDQINADLLRSQGLLEEMQEKLEQQTENLERVVKLHAQAILAVGAASGFAAQTGMHAADVGQKATETASAAIEATASLTEAVEARDEAVSALEELLEQNRVEDEKRLETILQVQEQVAKIKDDSAKGRTRRVFATRAGASDPDAKVTVPARRGGPFEVVWPKSRNSSIMVQFYEISGIGATLKRSTFTEAGSDEESWLSEAWRDEGLIVGEWYEPPGVVRQVYRSTGNIRYTKVADGAWSTIADLTVSTGARASQFDLTALVTWTDAYPEYKSGVRIVLNGEPWATRLENVGSSKSRVFSAVPYTQTVSLSLEKEWVDGAKIEVQVYSNGPDFARRIDRSLLSGSWVER